MMRQIKQLGEWFEARLRLGQSVLPMLQHPIPRSAAGPMGWWYVFGSASMTLFAIQILTGICLALVYVPSAGKAYDSLLYLTNEEPLGWFVRALHYYAGSGMVVMVLVHMTQVFLFGAYKYPRELTWVFGVCLLVLTLGMFFTGQILRWDPDAYWGLAVGSSMAGRVPVAGPWVVRLILGGAVIGGDSLSRFFALHVFVIPGLLIAALAVHLWLVLQCGISEAPQAGKPVDPRTYDAHYAEELHTSGVPFLGEAALRDLAVSVIAVFVVVVIAVIVGPKGPTGPPDPTLPGANPRPEWPFWWLFALLAMSPPQIETFVMLVFPVVLVLVLFLVPFISNRGERAPSRRPVAVLSVVVIYTVLGVLTYEGGTSPWSPQMDAWSSEPIPQAIVENSTPLQLAGAAVFQNKNCRNCHAINGVGGRRGPDLTHVGVRLTRNQLIDQVSNGTPGGLGRPGGGEMPAFGSQISPAQMTALVDFMVNLRPTGQPPAQSAAEPIAKPASKTAATGLPESQ